MHLKRKLLVLMAAGLALNSAFAFTTVENASRAPVAVPQPVTSDAKTKEARSAPEASASRPASGRPQAQPQPKAAPSGKDRQ